MEKNVGFSMQNGKLFCYFEELGWRVRVVMMIGIREMVISTSRRC